jgi:PIN domain nuclease of toxin-antitoxin system
MRLLVDTHVLLWALAQSRRIPKRTRQLLESPDHEVLFSAASLWEIAIKVQAGRLDLDVPLIELPEAAEAMGFVELPVRGVHAVRGAKLPLHHRDPFDRLLIAQAMSEPARLMTVDAVMQAYADVIEIVTF